MVKLPFYFGHEKLKITNPRKGTETLRGSHDVPP